MENFNLKDDTYYFIESNGEDIIPNTAVVFSCTDFDMCLVNGLLESFNFVEFFICYKDSGQNFDYDESVRHGNLIRLAEKYGAKWIYLTQPTMRAGKGSYSALKSVLTDNNNGIVCGSVNYFWDYSTNTIRTDGWFDQYGGCFFRSNESNIYGTEKLHHVALPKNLPKIPSSFKRYSMNRLGREVCIAKSKYYENKDGSKHETLKQFNNLTIKRIDPRLVAGLGSAEQKYIEKIREKYCDNPVQS